MVFRDVRDLSKGGNVGAGTDAERRSLALRLLGRARAAVASSLPGFFARLPRRAAEMALLVETVTAVGLAPAGFVDWGAEISSALFSSSIVGGSPWAWYLPAMLLILFVLGLLLLSDGLRLALEARPPPRPSDGVRPASFPSEDANP